MYIYACMLSRFSHVRFCVTLWTVAHQAPLSMEFSRLEYWNRLPFPPAGDLPNPGIEPASLMSPALAGRFFTTSATWEAPIEAAKYLTMQRTDPSADNYVAHITNSANAEKLMERHSS